LISEGGQSTSQHFQKLESESTESLSHLTGTEALFQMNGFHWGAFSDTGQSLDLDSALKHANPSLAKISQDLLIP
jgi:hypothetical protein